ncbi:MAG: hypothetical protein ASARMPRED_003092 [Alectoria sarmentosa]|nr:MAG: hypothetical protein ASARMPRED_003092 [Alectoria sarmentosa]
MDLDSGSAVTNQAAFKAEILDLQRQVEAKTSATVVSELLASRLHMRSPFGKVSLLLIVCSSLSIEGFDEEAHLCRCPEYCEPNFDDNLVLHVKDLLRDEVKEEVTTLEREKMAAEYREAYAKGAKEEARKAVNVEALKKARDRTVQIERKHLEDRLRTKITADIKQQFDDKFDTRLATAVKQRKLVQVPENYPSKAI